MKPEKAEMPHLWRRLLADQIRPYSFFFWLGILFFTGQPLLILWLLLYDETTIVATLTPGMKTGYGIALAVWLMNFSLLGRLRDKLYITLPVSRAAYADYVWFSQVVLPGLMALPLAMVALWRFSDAPFGALLMLVSVCTLPTAAATALCIQGALQSRATPNTALFLPFLVGMAILAIAPVMHYALVAYAQFPWLFVVMLLVSCVWGYIVRFRPVTSSVMTPRQVGSWPSLPKIPRLGRQEKGPLRAVGSRSVTLIVALLVCWFIFMCLDKAFATVFVSVLVSPAFFLCGGAYLVRRLSFLISMPLTPTRIAAAVLAYGLAGTALASLALATCSALIAPDISAPLPLNLILLCVCGSTFLPIVALSVGSPATAAIGLYSSIFLIAFPSAAGILPPLSGPLSLPLAAVLACVVLNFILLRRALRRMTPGQSLVLLTRRAGVPVETVTNQL